VVWLLLHQSVRSNRGIAGYRAVRCAGRRPERRREARSYHGRPETDVVTGRRPSETARGASFERQATRIANARSVTFGLAATFFVLSFVGAIVMRFADAHNFPSVGLAFWWALQTMTTVGYGDVVPTTSAGKIVGGIEMMIGISLISLLTAAVTSTVIQRGEKTSREEDRANLERTGQSLLTAIAQIDDRLGRLESQSRQR
jgi:voltage-gated potassium channel